MRQAFQAVKRNRGAAGVDKVSIQMFAANLEENLAALMRELKTGTFQPLPLRRVHIPKGPGSTKLRPLGIPVVRDRIAQEVDSKASVPRSLNRSFTRTRTGSFPDATATRRSSGCWNSTAKGTKWCSTRISRDSSTTSRIASSWQPWRPRWPTGTSSAWSNDFLPAGVMEDGVFKPTTIGTPQGGVISPLLANIVLNRLDWQLHEAGYRFARYADDFVVLCQDPSRRKRR